MTMWMRIIGVLIVKILFETVLSAKHLIHSIWKNDIS